MRWLMVSIALVTLSTTVRAKEPPLVERYLHSGELSKGEQALQAALAEEPRNDQIRFGLGVLQFVRGVERLGQSLHEYGVKSENTNVPFLRLPVPKNAKPAPISYTAFRRVLDDFIRDLSAADATLAGITDEQVKLPLRLAAVRLDLEGTGKANDKLIDILKKLMRQDFEFLRSNPEFLVCFDRGDVAWLRAYCHLLSSMLDFYLAFDTEALFDLSAHEMFEKPRHRFKGTEEKRNERLNEASRVIVVKEPLRLARFRTHLLQVCALNRETWKFIRAETDDDHEWLPNPRQKGVLGLPVRDGMIDAWLRMMEEFESMLEGKKLVPTQVLWPKDSKNLNLKKLLNHPPERFDFDCIRDNGAADRYLEKGEVADIFTVLRAFQMFDNTLGFAYAVWFN